jgi:hypothetical protein
MIVNARRRRRFGRLAGLLAIGVLAVGAVSVGATAGSAATTASTAHAAASAAGATVRARAQVPWSKVGPGWELAEYEAGPAGKAAPVTLYLISPAGVRYPMHTWSGRGTVPYLIAWSGDKTRALLGLSGSRYDLTGSQYEQLTLSTGKFTVGRLAGQAEPTGYTLPDGQNILGITAGTASATVARYSLAGKLLKVLTRGADEHTAVYAANGTALAVSGAKGLELVSNGGGVIRSLPVPGTAPSVGCYPARWWNPNTVLTECLANGADGPRLWLVPANGNRPVALTPQRHGTAGDFGDIGAWQLSSGLYLQALGACGTVEIVRQAANGSITPVVPAHATANNNAIVTALGPRLLIDAQTGCPGSTSLLWYNPATHAEQWVLRAPADGGGVIGVVAYHSTENALPL